MVDNNKIYEAIRSDLLKIFQESLQRVGQQGSEVYRTLKVTVNDSSDIFKVIYNDYLDYIDSGRRPKAKRVPIRDLIAWCKKKGLPSDNNTVYAIQQSIYNKGIPSKPIFDYINRSVDVKWDKEWADELFNEITDKILN